MFIMKIYYSHSLILICLDKLLKLGKLVSKKLKELNFVINTETYLLHCMSCISTYAKEQQTSSFRKSYLRTS